MISEMTKCLLTAELTQIENQLLLRVTKLMGSKWQLCFIGLHKALNGKYHFIIPTIHDGSCLLIHSRKLVIEHIQVVE